MRTDTIRELSAQITTPAYIFDFDVFEERAALVKRYFGDHIGLCFSIKANPFLLKYLPDNFDRIEVCSPGELTVCEKTGVDMQKIIFSGVNKTLEDISRAMDDGVGVFTAESMLHVSLIEEEAVRRGVRVPLLLRLTAGSQFGMSEEEILSVIESRESYQGFEIVGLHFFSGTQKKKVKTIEKELNYLDEFCRKIRSDLDFEVERIEYGTGLAVDYFSENADSLEEERLSEVAAFLREFAEKYHLTVEMGRFFAASCGYYLTRVMDVKTNKGVNYAILDGGLNQLKYDGQIKGMKIPEIFHLTTKESVSNPIKDDVWALCGSLCTTEDVLAVNVPFETLFIGDILVFCRTGAYSVSEGMALFLSRELPQISLYSEKRGIETVREIIRSDLFNTP